MVKLLWCFIAFCILTGCTLTRGRHTYENGWDIPGQSSIIVNSTSKDEFPIIVYNKSKGNVPLKVMIKEGSYSKIINRNDSLALSTHINKGIIISNSGKEQGVMRIKVYNHNGSIKESRLQ
jgi:hypothetical protein